jgi:hypothetical protein
MHVRRIRHAAQDAVSDRERQATVLSKVASRIVVSGSVECAGFLCSIVFMRPADAAVCDKYGIKKSGI